MKPLYEVIKNLKNESLEEVEALLDSFNGIDGDSVGFNDPIYAARLNQRYKDLTGHDHERYLTEEPKVIGGLLKDEKYLLSQGIYLPVYFYNLRRIQDGLEGRDGLQIVEGDHPITHLTSVMSELSTSSLEDVTSLLDIFNGDPLLINGVQYHTYNDPIYAARLNQRYKDLTGSDHERYLAEEPIVIGNLLKEENFYLAENVYTPFYFDSIRRIKEGLEGKGPGLPIIEGDHPLRHLDSTIRNLSSAKLEDVSALLDSFNSDSLLINGDKYFSFNDPIYAARLNARYKELTGNDHERYLSEQPKVVNDLLANEKMLSSAYTPFFFNNVRRIKEGLEGKGPGLEISESDHPINRFRYVLENLETVSAEEIGEQLDYFNGKPVLVQGSSMYPFNEPMMAARLNARFKALTGHDHERYLAEEPKMIAEYLKNERLLSNSPSSSYTPFYFGNLRKIRDELEGKGPGLDFSESSNHPINRFTQVVLNLGEASEEEISEQLDYFNNNNVVIKGVPCRGFNDPLTAYSLNRRYKELTGRDHERYLSEQPKVIEGLLRDRKEFERQGVFREGYYEEIERIVESDGLVIRIDESKFSRIYEGAKGGIKSIYDKLTAFRNRGTDDRDKTDNDEIK